VRSSAARRSFSNWNRSALIARLAEFTCVQLELPSPPAHASTPRDLTWIRRNFLVAASNIPAPYHSALPAPKLALLRTVRRSGRDRTSAWLHIRQEHPQDAWLPAACQRSFRARECLG